MPFRCLVPLRSKRRIVVKRGPWKRVPRSRWRGRHRDGRNFLQTAEEALALTDPGDSGKPVMSNALRAVIAYGDALTIKYGRIQNTQDHSTLPRAIKQALGQRAEEKQVRRLRRLLGQKNDIDYHHRDLDLDEARRFLKRARRFARWAEEELMR